MTNLRFSSPLQPNIVCTQTAERASSALAVATALQESQCWPEHRLTDVVFRAWMFVHKTYLRFILYFLAACCRCKCKKQFNKLDALLAHENICSGNSDNPAAATADEHRELASSSSTKPPPPAHIKPPPQAVTKSPPRAHIKPPPQAAVTGASASPERAVDFGASPVDDTVPRSAAGAQKQESLPPGAAADFGRPSQPPLPVAAAGSDRRANANDTSLLTNLLQAFSANPSMTIADFLTVRGLVDVTGVNGIGLAAPSSSPAVPHTTQSPKLRAFGDVSVARSTSRSPVVPHTTQSSTLSAFGEIPGRSSTGFASRSNSPVGPHLAQRSNMSVLGDVPGTSSAVLGPPSSSSVVPHPMQSSALSTFGDNSEASNAGLGPSSSSRSGVLQLPVTQVSGFDVSTDTSSSLLFHVDPQSTGLPSSSSSFGELGTSQSFVHNMSACANDVSHASVNSQGHLPHVSSTHRVSSSPHRSTFDGGTSASLYHHSQLRASPSTLAMASDSSATSTSHLGPDSSSTIPILIPHQSSSIINSHASSQSSQPKFVSTFLTEIPLTSAPKLEESLSVPRMGDIPVSSTPLHSQPGNIDIPVSSTLLHPQPGNLDVPVSSTPLHSQPGNLSLSLARHNGFSISALSSDTVGLQSVSQSPPRQQGTEPMLGSLTQSSSPGTPLALSQPLPSAAYSAADTSSQFAVPMKPTRSTKRESFDNSSGRSNPDTQLLSRGRVSSDSFSESHRKVRFYVMIEHVCTQIPEHIPLNVPTRPQSLCIFRLCNWNRVALTTRRNLELLVETVIWVASPARYSG